MSSTTNIALNKCTIDFLTSSVKAPASTPAIVKIKSASTPESHGSFWQGANGGIEVEVGGVDGIGKCKSTGAVRAVVESDGQEVHGSTFCWQQSHSQLDGSSV